MNDLRNANGGLVNPAVDKQVELSKVTVLELICAGIARSLEWG